MSNLSVFDMVHAVINNSRAQLQKTASSNEEEETEEQGAEETTEEEKEKESAAMYGELNKLADACDFLSQNLHTVVDARSPQEKLAEYAMIHDALLKSAEDIPMDPPLNSGHGYGGPNSAMETSMADASGESMDTGEGGQATQAHQPEKVTDATEKALPTDAGNAFPTNFDMMKDDQPEELLKQNQAQAILGRLVRSGHVKLSSATRVLKKMAGEMDDASISSGTTPQLQSIPGVPSPLSQGSEVGELTPRETAPNVGEGSGRQYISSIEAAIAMTKGQAKGQNRGPLAELLTEPAMSAATDRTLHESLQNTSSAGVKLAATRTLLKKLAASSPEMKTRINALVKKAQGIPVNPEEAANLQGGYPVSPEEMMYAQMLAEQMGQQGMQGEPMEKEEQMMGGAPMGGGTPQMGGGAPQMGGAQAAPPPPQTMPPM